MRMVVSIVPEYYWEIQWTVQVVENGLYMEKYFGGYNTSMIFEYSRVDDTFELLWWANVWSVPEECTSCVDSCGGDGGLSPFEYYSGFRYDGLDPPLGSTTTQNIDYNRTSWFVANASDLTALVSHGKLYCTEEDYSPMDCLGCLADGSYVYRTTGAFDEDDVHWTFCGVSWKRTG